MSFIDDMLNGGIDRDFDGDIDKRDRDIMFAEESIAKEIERRETTYEYDYDDEFDDDFDDETDCDDIADFYSSCRHPMTVSASTKKKTILFPQPTYNGQKTAKDDKVIIEWENMPSEVERKAKRAYSVYLLFFTVFLFGIVICLLLPAVFYEDVDDISPFIICGLGIGFIGFILTCWSSCKSFELTKYYTHIEDKNGRKKYRSEYEASKKFTSETDISQKK